jgi:hypothetical protein
MHRKKFNIYITSDEEIKEANWVLGDYPDNPIGKVIAKYGKEYTVQCLNGNKCGLAQYDAKKIILTTDQNLIKNGVQAIDDTFLKWFVNNPSCEEVEVESWQPYADFDFDYKIIIPQEKAKQECLHQESSFRGYYKDGCYTFWGSGIIVVEEPKKETLEEAAEKYVENFSMSVKSARQIGFIDGAKLQAERIGLMEIELNHTKTLLASCEKALEDRDKKAERRYSEEDMRLAINKARDISDGENCFDVEDVSGCTEVCTYGWKFNMSEDSIIEQFKKK